MNAFAFCWLMVFVVVFIFVMIAISENKRKNGIRDRAAAKELVLRDRIAALGVKIASNPIYVRELLKLNGGHVHTSDFYLCNDIQYLEACKLYGDKADIEHVILRDSGKDAYVPFSLSKINLSNPSESISYVKAIFQFNHHKEAVFLLPITEGSTSIVLDRLMKPHQEADKLVRYLKSIPADTKALEIYNLVNDVDVIKKIMEDPEYRDELHAFLYDSKLKSDIKEL